MNQQSKSPMEISPKFSPMDIRFNRQRAGDIISQAQESRVPTIAHEGDTRGKKDSDYPLEPPPDTSLSSEKVVADMGEEERGNESRYAPESPPSTRKPKGKISLSKSPGRSRKKG